MRNIKRCVAATTVAAMLLSSGTVPIFAAPAEGLENSITESSQVQSYDVGNYITVDNLCYRITGEKTVSLANPSYATKPDISNYTGVITVPASIEYDTTTYSVTGVDDAAFSRSSVETVSLPATIQSIGGSAFADCASLTAIAITDTPSHLTSIGTNAFSNCTSLTSLNLPNSVTNIGRDALNNLESLTSLKIPAGVTQDLRLALRGYSHPEGITIDPDSPYTYDASDGVLYNGTVAEYWLNRNVINISIKDSTTEIGPAAFQAAQGGETERVSSVLLPPSVTKIGASAFNDTNLTSIDLTYVTEIDDKAFMGNSDLSNVTWPQNLSSLGANAFQKCTSLQTVEINGSIDEIPSSCFSGCLALESVKLPEGLEKIGDSAFYLVTVIGSGINISVGNPNPKLESINIPSTVTNIGTNFLGGVKSDTALIFEGDNPPTFDSGALTGISGSNTKPTVYYPAGAEEAYVAENCALVTSGLVSASSEGQEDDQAMSLSVSPASGGVQVGQTATFTVTHSPEAATVSVTNSSDAVATASMNGNTLSVTGQSVGSTTVTLHLQINGYEVMTKDIAVTVTAAPSLTLNRDTASLYWNTQNNTLQLNATLTGATDTVAWKSSDESVATVDENGLVTAHRPGTAVITASAGDLSDSCTVTVSTYVSPSPDPTPTPEPEPETPAVTTDDNAGTTETTAKPEVTVSGGTASATVSDEMGKEIVNQATENDSATVIIAPEMDDDVTSTEVTLPSATVDSIGTDTNADIVISTPVANVTLPNGGLSDLASAGGDITVSASVDGNTVQFSVTANGEPVTEVTGGVTLVVPASDTTAGTVAVIVYDDGTREVVRKSVAGDDSVTIPLSGSATVEIIDNSKDFDDVSAGAWYSDVVDFASSHELFNGTSATTFSPNDAMTRGMLAAVLANLESADVSGMQSAFNDVHDEEWYSESVAWAAENGIVNGYGDGAFGPNDAITREQLAAMLYNYADMLGLDTTARASLAGYNDQPSAWATDVMQWAVAEGLITGTSSDTLDPQGTATRAQVAAMLERFFENVL